MSAPALLRALMRAAMVLLAPSGASGQTAAPTQHTGTVVFGGDVVPHGDLLASFETHGPASLYAPIAPVIRAADLAFVNFETPAAPSRPIARSGLRFNVHEDFVRALVDAGFDGASVANNHSYDLGVAPVGETVATLRRAGLRPIGGALPGEDPLTPQRFPLAGGTLCVFAATRLLNYDMGAPGRTSPRVALARPVPSAEQEALLAAVHAQRPSCGAVLVSLHTGVEYQDRPEGVDRVFFRRLAAAGADAILAHHSHTPQPMEVWEGGGRRVPIFYSLGNFVSNQGYSADANTEPNAGGHWHVGLDPRLREGLLAVLRFENDGQGALRLAEFGYVPLWTVNTHLSTPPGQTLTISAALMPREGGGDAMLTQRWRGLVSRVGAQYLLPASALPGGAEAYPQSEAAVLANRRGRDASSAMLSEAASGRRGEAPDRARR